MDKEEADQLNGRMMEDCDIQMAIESGQFKTLDDVLLFTAARAESIQAELRKHGYLGRSITREEFEEAARSVDHHMQLVQFDISGSKSN